MSPEPRHTRSPFRATATVHTRKRFAITPPTRSTPNALTRELPSTPTITHRILPEPLGGSIAQNKLPGQRDREKLCFRGRRSPVGRGARHEAPRGRGKPPGRQVTAAPRGVANSPDPRSCAGRARLPVLPARGRRSTRSSPAARPASPVPAPGPPRRGLPRPPDPGRGRAGGARSREARPRKRPGPQPRLRPRRAPPRLPRNSASRPS